MCIEPCYVKWSDLIEVEANKTTALSANASELLESFGGKTVTADSISQTLTGIRNDVGFADNIFKGVHFENSTTRNKDRLEEVLL